MNLGIETPIDLSEIRDAVHDITRRKRNLNKDIDWRWARKGVQGVRLEYVRDGRRIGIGISRGAATKEGS